MKRYLAVVLLLGVTPLSAHAQEEESPVAAPGIVANFDDPDDVITVYGHRWREGDSRLVRDPGMTYIVDDTGPVRTVVYSRHLFSIGNAEFTAETVGVEQGGSEHYRRLERSVRVPHLGVRIPLPLGQPARRSEDTD